MKVLSAVPNPVDLGKTPVGFPSGPEIARLTISNGATFIEEDLVSFLTDEFEVARKAGVQHIHSGYSFEPGIEYYVDNLGVLTTDPESGVVKAGVGTADNGLLIGMQTYPGDLIDEYRQFFVDEDGVGFDDPGSGNVVVFVDEEGRLMVDSYDNVFIDAEI